MLITKFNHTANAELVARLTEGNLKYDPATNKWYYWSSGDWLEDKYPDEHIRAAAAYREANLDQISDSAQKKLAKDWANGSFNSYHMRATREVMERMEDFAFPESNASTMLFKTQNQVVDLTNMDVRPAKKADGLIYGSGVEFDGDAECPIWEGLVQTALHDSELIHYFQKVVGYMLTGETSEQVFFHLVGVPGSGKSRIVATLAKLLGDYAHPTDFKVFAKTRAESSMINHGLAPMRGKRLITSSEPSRADKWDDKTIKTITGEDTITCRFIKAEEFQYTPQFKVVVMSNWKIYTEDLSGAFERRYIPIPFDVSFTEDPERTPDLQLGKKLDAELPGILNWALIGCVRWQREGLSPIPAAILEGRTAQRVENRANVFGGVYQFAEECLQKSNYTRTSATEVYSAYTHWAAGIGIPPHSILGSPAKVSEVLRDIGYAPYRTNSSRGFMAELVSQIRLG